VHDTFRDPRPGRELVSARCPHAGKRILLACMSMFYTIQQAEFVQVAQVGETERKQQFHERSNRIYSSAKAELHIMMSCSTT
jgi:hypothetical protein